MNIARHKALRIHTVSISQNAFQTEFDRKIVCICVNLNKKRNNYIDISMAFPVSNFEIT